MTSTPLELTEVSVTRQRLCSSNDGLLGTDNSHITFRPEQGVLSQTARQHKDRNSSANDEEEFTLHFSLSDDSNI